MYIHLTQTDILIDFFCMLLFWGIIYHCMSLIASDNREVTTKHRIVYSLMIFSSLIFSIQVLTQMYTGRVASVQMWDIMNYAQAMSSLGILHVMRNRIHMPFAQHHSLLAKMPFL